MGKVVENTWLGIKRKSILFVPVSILSGGGIGSLEEKGWGWRLQSRSSDCIGTIKGKRGKFDPWFVCSVNSGNLFPEIQIFPIEQHVQGDQKWSDQNSKERNCWIK